MATVRFFPNDGPPILTALHKPVTTLGRALGNDIHLPGRERRAPSRADVFNGRGLSVEELDREGEILIKARRSGERALQR